MSQFLFDAGANIVSSDQHSTDPRGGSFFLRMVFDLALSNKERRVFAERFGREVAARFGFTWSLWDAARPKRIAILVSRYEHCLLDLLWRWRRGELDGG